MGAVPGVQQVEVAARVRGGWLAEGWAGESRLGWVEASGGVKVSGVADPGRGGLGCVTREP